MSEIVQTVYSDTGRHRANVVKISRTAFRIDVERRHEDVDAGGYRHGYFWSHLSGWRSYADTLDRALELATENLRTSEAS
jgi:hypothetical protein